MPLRGDQRALLQLLSERGQSYEDISGLLGVAPDEVQKRAREALSELGGADPDAQVGVTDFLLGQADPIGRADAVRYLQTDLETLELARRIEAALREVAPAATLPKLPEPRGKRAKAAVPAPGESPGPPPGPAGGGEPTATGPAGEPGRSTDPRQNQLIAALVAAGLILLFAILAISGSLSGGDDETTPTSAANTTTSADDSTTTTDASATNITTVELSPSGGSGVGGTASFGLVSNSQLYVDLEIQGLDPTPAKDTTTLAWLMVGTSGGYPINNPVDSPITPDQNGSYSGRIAVPSAVALTVGGQATAVKISSSPIEEVAAAAKKAAQQQAPILSFIGTELASGDIPLAKEGSPDDAAPAPSTTTTPGG